MLRAIIFDLDGVICSTDQYHYQAWKSLADSLGIYFDETINNRLRGVSRMASLEIILEKSDKTYTNEEKIAFAEKKNAIYRELLHQLTPKDLSDEVRTTLARLRAQGLKLAIGSSSKNTLFILERIGLDGFFDAVSDGNGLIHSKPDPEVFLKAAKMIQIPPNECMVVEDALAGAQAAANAGMMCACVGDAARLGAGNIQLPSFGFLTDVCQSL